MKGYTKKRIEQGEKDRKILHYYLGKLLNIINDCELDEKEKEVVYEAQYAYDNERENKE